MATPMETVVHIPPPDDESPADRRWILPLVLVTALFVIILLLFQTRPLPPAFEWSGFEGPSGSVNVDSLVAYDEGFALLSGITPEGVSLWWSDEFGSWKSQILEGAPSQLAAGGARLAAYRVLSGSVIVPDDEEWTVEFHFEFPEETRSRQASGRPGVFVANDELIELSLFGNVWWSPRGEDFRLVVDDPAWGHGVEQPFRSACQPPSRSSPDVPPMVDAAGTLMALVPSNTDEPFGIWPACEPDLWSSSDGTTWSKKDTSLGEEGAYVYDLAWREGTMFAVGGYGIGQPAAWTSGDGVEWTEITPFFEDSVDLYRVEAGGAGWVILGRDSFESVPVGWTSRDGSCWEPLESPVEGGEAVVSDDGILLVDRTEFPDMWLGIPTGSPGACR